MTTDYIIVNNTNVIGSYSTDQHTYFIGSATKLNVPLNFLKNNIKLKYCTDIRITRVCNNDVTQKFESRIDIALTCSGVGKFYKTLLKYK